MNTPPRKIDGASVLEFATLDGTIATGMTRHVVAGVQVDGFKHLVIARYDGDPGYYLFYCDAAWCPITDTYHETLGSAIAQAGFEFGEVQFAQAVELPQRDGRPQQSED